MTDRRAKRDPPSVRFEAKDVPSWLPLWLGAGLAGFIIVVLVGIAVSFPLADHQQFRGPLQPRPPLPRLQLAPGADLRDYRKAKDREFAYSNLSIEQAMLATAHEGWGPPR